MPFQLNSQTGQYDFEPYEEDDNQQVDIQVAEAPKPKAEKPWWEQAKDSIMKGPGLGRYLNVTEEGLVLNTDNISNDLQYEAKRLTQSPGSAGQRLLDYATSSPQLNLLVPGGTDLNTEARAANAQALGNAQKALYPFVAGGSKIKEPTALGENPTEEETATYNEQRDAYDAQERQKQVDTLDYEAAVDERVESVYVSSEKKPRSEMTDAELAGDDFKASIALNAGLVAAEACIPPLGLAPRTVPSVPRLLPTTSAPLTGLVPEITSPAKLAEPS